MSNQIWYGFLKEGAGAGSFRGLLSLGRTISTSMKLEDILRDINNRVVEPFINFIHDQIDDSGNVLFRLQLLLLHVVLHRFQSLLPSTHSCLHSATPGHEAHYIPSAQVQGEGPLVC